MASKRHTAKILGSASRACGAGQHWWPDWGKGVTRTVIEKNPNGSVSLLFEHLTCERCHMERFSYYLCRDGRAVTQSRYYKKPEDWEVRNDLKGETGRKAILRYEQIQYEQPELKLK